MSERGGRGRKLRGKDKQRNPNTAKETLPHTPGPLRAGEGLASVYRSTLQFGVCRSITWQY